MTDEEKLKELEDYYTKALNSRDWLGCELLAEEIDTLERLIRRKKLKNEGD